MAMKNGVCPECGGKDIRVREGHLNNYAVMFQQPKIHIYVCTECGYVAQFMSPEDVEHIYDSWSVLSAADDEATMDGEIVDIEFNDDDEPTENRKKKD